MYKWTLSMAFLCLIQLVIAQETIYETLDTLTVSAPADEPVFSLSPYNASATKRFDLIHTKLELSFDWAKTHVLGKASLELKPYFYDQQILLLDAKGFDIHEVINLNGGQTLDYEYDGYKLMIDLGRLYTKDESVNVFIDYTAKPNEGPNGGSPAIRSDRGLFFIDPLMKDPNKPEQIWTQGETESNSRWFPTIDKPNERTTQEMVLTVDDRFTTLSNGTLISSTKNEDGTRTDHWNMDISHAPYLFMLAVGEYAVVKEYWNDVPIEYYVEPEYEPYAKEIYNHTPEMMTFFSDYLGVPYPWQKMAHVVVRDFVSGAMENTTGVIYGEYVQKTDRQMIDNHNDLVVAHEIIHHWFGNYVTLESWANTVLNEGFANYGEYLWVEYKYGKDAAEYLRMSELAGYMNSANNRGVRPLIQYDYDHRDDLFDAHSYNKGGLTMHMLSNYVGEDAFRAALNKYLVDNAYSDVEGDEMRMAFEDVTGEDLNWFFDQWFFSPGHPVIDIVYKYDPDSKTQRITVYQKQDPKAFLPIFQFPAEVRIFDSSGQVSAEEVWVDQRVSTFSFPANEEPTLVLFDANRSVICERTENKTPEQYAQQYFLAGNLMDRYDALQNLRGQEEYQYVFKKALSDPYFAIRLLAINDYPGELAEDVIARLEYYAENDVRSEVRRGALRKLSNNKSEHHMSLVESILDKELAYPVIGEALSFLHELSPESGVKRAEAMIGEKSTYINMAQAQIFADSGSDKYLDFYKDRLESISIYRTYSFYDLYFNLLKDKSADLLLNNAEALKSIAMNLDLSRYRRYAATNTINKLKSHISNDEERGEGSALKLAEMIEEIKNNETNEMLKSRYSSF